MHLNKKEEDLWDAVFTSAQAARKVAQVAAKGGDLEGKRLNVAAAKRGLETAKAVRRGK